MNVTAEINNTPTLKCSASTHSLTGSGPYANALFLSHSRVAVFRHSAHCFLIKLLGLQYQAVLLRVVEVKGRKIAR